MWFSIASGGQFVEGGFQGMVSGMFSARVESKEVPDRAKSTFQKGTLRKM